MYGISLSTFSNSNSPILALFFLFFLSVCQRSLLRSPASQHMSLLLSRGGKKKCKREPKPLKIFILIFLKLQFSACCFIIRTGDKLHYTIFFFFFFVCEYGLHMEKNTLI
jgi:hypothetical protein